MDTLILYIVAAALFALSFLKDRTKTKAAVRKGLAAFEGILPQFIVVMAVVAASLAVLDPDAISRLLGDSSGAAGAAVAAAVGAVTLIPGFVAFPLAGELLRGGAGLYQVAVFVSALMMVGVVTLPVEISVFGKRAAIARNVLALAFSFAAAAFVAWAAS